MPAANRRKQRAGRTSFRLDDLPEAVIVTDARHVVAVANRKALELLGYSPSEIIGWPLEKIFPKTPRGLVSVMAGASAKAEFDVKARTRSGKRAMLGFQAAPIVRRDRIVGVVYIGRDVRIRSILDAELKRSRDLFRAVIENAPYGICVTDRSRRVIMANRLAADIIGRSVPEMVGETVTSFYPTEAGAPELDMVALHRGKPITRQMRFHRRDGREVPVLASYRLFVPPDGREEMIIESYNDQTDRMRVDQLKNEFVFVAAHELRNPVTAIKLLLDIIFEDKRLAIEPVLRGYLDKVQEANTRLLQLVDDLLEVSRTEAGQLKIQVGPQDIVAHISGIIAEMRPSALTKNVVIDYAPPAKLPEVSADSNKLKEIVGNLISNAIKYNIDGGCVTISHEVAGKELVTRVADTGIGISDEDQKKLFGKFWRSEDLAVRAQAGTGLGLFIVKELVERMGGRIWVESKKGKGSTFSFSLPIV